VNTLSYINAQITNSFEYFWGFQSCFPNQKTIKGFFFHQRFEIFCLLNYFFPREKTIICAMSHLSNALSEV